MRITLAPDVAERALYPCYPDEWVPEEEGHELQVRYLRDALTVALPGHRVSGNLWMLGWDGTDSLPMNPDVVVLEGPEPCGPKDCYAWTERAVLFAADVSGRGSAMFYDGPRTEDVLQCLGAECYLYVDRKNRSCSLHVLQGPDIQEVQPGSDGRVGCSLFNLKFGFVNSGLMRVFVDGSPLPTYAEQHLRVAAAEQGLERTRAWLTEQ